MTKKYKYENDRIINFCGWCGDYLPPYKDWKWCLCPKCNEEEND